MRVSPCTPHMHTTHVQTTKLSSVQGLMSCEWKGSCNEEPRILCWPGDTAIDARVYGGMKRKESSETETSFPICVCPTGLIQRQIRQRNQLLKIYKVDAEFLYTHDTHWMRRQVRQKQSTCKYKEKHSQGKRRQKQDVKALWEAGSSFVVGGV